MKAVVKLLGCMVLSVVLAVPAMAQAESPDGPILFTNVNVFDGVSDKLIRNANVVVTGNIITAVSTEDLTVAGGRVIDGGGRVMTPGFIDSHSHLMSMLSWTEAMNSDEFYIAYVATQSARTYLMHGFTTVREAGGNSFALKKAIDRGIVVGPRCRRGPERAET